MRSFSFDNYCKAFRFSPKGRAPRAEFWSFAGFTAIYTVLLLVLCLLASAFLPGPFATILTWCTIAFLFLSGIILWIAAARRLHDTGRSGWWVLAYAVLFEGSNLLNGSEAIPYGPFGAALDLAAIALWLTLTVFLCLKSDPKENRYGPPPSIGSEADGQRPLP